MSLRSFHLFFITVSVLTAFFFAGWAANEFAGGSGGGILALGLISLVVGVGLIFYGRAFRKKFSELPDIR